MALIYDIEIKNAIQGRNEPRISGLSYCMGWDDHKGMGIAVLCALDTDSGIMHTLTPEESTEHKELLHNLLSCTDYIIGFNNHSFDNKILAAQGYAVPKHRSYDIHEQVIKAAGGGFRKGYKLEQIAQANKLGSKTEGVSGADAPAMYQSGEPEKIAKLHEYCRNDVQLTYDILECISNYHLICPVSGTALDVATPVQVLGVIQKGFF
jgi:hypothetical protein